MPNNLVNLFNYSFPGVNILNISLVSDNDSELPGYKLKHFCFIRLIPGAQSDSGGRTFSPKDAINFKIEPHKLFAMANAIKTYSNVAMRMQPNQQKPKIPAFTMFADSSKSVYGGQEKKSLNLDIGNFDKYGNPSIVMFFQAGQRKIVYSCDVYTAYGISRVLEMIAENAVKLEAERVILPQNVNKNRPAPTQGVLGTPQSAPNFQQPQQPMQQQESPITNPVNNDAQNISGDAQKALNDFSNAFSSPFGNEDGPF